MKDYIHREPQKKGPRKSVVLDNCLVWGENAKILDHRSILCTHLLKKNNKNQEQFRFMNLNKMLTQFTVGYLSYGDLITAILDKDR